MRMHKLLVMANPYAHIDANGRLAGATPLGEHPRHTSVPPAREYVGATRVLVEHDAVGRGIGSPQLPRSEYMFVWGDKPIEVDASRQLGPYYAQRIREGELFACDKAGAAPLQALAAARVAAFARFKAETGEEPSAAEWSEQFQLDDDVAMAASILQEQAKADVEKAKAEAKAADEKAAEDAKAAKLAEADNAKKHADGELDRKARVARRLGIKLPDSPVHQSHAPPGSPPEPAPHPGLAGNEPADPKTTRRASKEP